MNKSEKFCLKWEDFQKNIVGNFKDLREGPDFTDVTLACDDQQVEAHKVILSASSPFFQNILKINKHPHPLIYMRGLKYKDLVSIVDFIYHGEVNIHQEDLNTFLDLATEMELKGLAGSSSDEATEDFKQHNLMMEKSSVSAIKPTNYLRNDIEDYTNQTAIAKVEADQKHTVTANGDVVEQIKSMMEKIDGLWGRRSTIRLPNTTSLLDRLV